MMMLNNGLRYVFRFFRKQVMMMGELYRFYGRMMKLIMVLIMVVWWKFRWCGNRLVSVQVGVMKFVIRFIVMVRISSDRLVRISRGLLGMVCIILVGFWISVLLIVSCLFVRMMMMVLKISMLMGMFQKLFMMMVCFEVVLCVKLQKFSMKVLQIVIYSEVVFSICIYIVVFVSVLGGVQCNCLLVL